MSDEASGDALPIANTIKPKPVMYSLRLFVVGHTPKSEAALANLTRICEEYLAGRHEIEVVDLLEQPQLARREEILAIPTLVRTLPRPMCRIIGDLSNTERVLKALDIRPGN